MIYISESKLAFAKYVLQIGHKITTFFWNTQEFCQFFYIFVVFFYKKGSFGAFYLEKRAKIQGARAGVFVF